MWKVWPISLNVGGRKSDDAGSFWLSSVFREGQIDFVKSTLKHL